MRARGSTRRAGSSRAGGVRPSAASQPPPRLAPLHHVEPRSRSVPACLGAPACSAACRLLTALLPGAAACSGSRPVVPPHLHHPPGRRLGRRVRRRLPGRRPASGRGRRRRPRLLLAVAVARAGRVDARGQAGRRQGQQGQGQGGGGHLVGTGSRWRQRRQDQPVGPRPQEGGGSRSAGGRDHPARRGVPGGRGLELGRRRRRRPAVRDVPHRPVRHPPQARPRVAAALDRREGDDHHGGLRGPRRPSAGLPGRRRRARLEVRRPELELPHPSLTRWPACPDRADHSLCPCLAGRPSSTSTS